MTIYHDGKYRYYLDPDDPNDILLACLDQTLGVFLYENPKMWGLNPGDDTTKIERRFVEVYHRSKVTASVLKNLDVVSRAHRRCSVTIHRNSQDGS